MGIWVNAIVKQHKRVFCVVYWQGDEAKATKDMVDRLASLWVATRGYVEGLPIFGGGNGFVCGTNVVGITIIGINWCNACMFSGHSAFERVDISSRVLSNFDSKTL